MWQEQEISKLPAIFRAISNDPEAAQRMIQEGTDLNQIAGIRQHTPLLHALYHKKFYLARLLIERGADVLYENSFGLSALSVTCFGRSEVSEDEIYEICKLLVERGVDCNSHMLGSTPVGLAFFCRSLKTIQLLLDHGADISPANKFGGASLHSAAINPHVDVLEFALKQGFDIDYTDSRGRTPLHAAAEAFNSEGCELLLRHGAGVNKRTDQPNGSPPLLLTIMSNIGNIEVSKTVEVLLKYGGNVSEKVRGRSILEWAAKFAAVNTRVNITDQFAVPLNPYSDIRYIFMRHVARMKYINLSIPDDDRRTIENNRFYKASYDFCVEELEKMKETKFYNDVSVFSIFMDSKKVISGYARNEELVNALEETNYDDKFPAYFTGLKRQFYAEVERQRLQKTTANILCDLFMVNDPFHPVILNITRYLSQEHLKLLCSDFVSTSFSQSCILYG